MDTTTPVDGVASDQAVGNSPGSQVTQPTTTEAVAEEAQADSTSQTDDQQTAEAVSSEPQETQATNESEDDIKSWAEKKGLPLEDPVKLAQMYRDAEKKMHEATSKAREFNQAVMEQPLVDYTGNEVVDQLATQVNQLTIQNKVNSFFEAVPEAREFETKMAELVVQRPHLQNDLDALYALARNDPTREADLRREGGREALTTLAQKQQAVPPSANAVNPGVFASSKITPENVDELVKNNSNEWYEANRDEILRAAYGRN